MARRFAFVFGFVGFLLGVCYYAGGFAPLTGVFWGILVRLACFGCVDFVALHSARVGWGVLVLAPLNGLIYAVIGFLVGRLFTVAKAWRQGRRSGDGAIE
ncbi:MAG TPA: hypothetical protein VLT85_01955 [Terriglobales bacterium]|nr:hypothetical protein [Terriglobales bacterium]